MHVALKPTSQGRVHLTLSKQVTEGTVHTSQEDIATSVSAFWAPKLGKVYTFDVLELRVPAEHTGATFFYLVVEKVSKFAMGGTMRGYSEANVMSALNKIKSRVRPTHGEIEIIRMDSHPSHRSKSVRDYMLDAQQRLQLLPPYVHEGVGDVENFFLHQVPSANALLSAAPDLGENHFAQAMCYVIDAKNYSVSVLLTSDSSDPKSPAMIFYSFNTFVSSGLHVFGSAAKALVHGEARDSKFDDHAKPCVYVGPPINSDSRAHCAVWFKREYKDVAIGCVVINEDVVLERTRRDHVSTQPYNQVAALHVVDLGAPTSIFELSGMDYSEAELPYFDSIVWVRSMDMPVIDFALLLWHGDRRAGDMTSWMLELSNKLIMPIPIDLVIGGQEHNLTRGPIKSAVLHMGKSMHCRSFFMQCTCSPFSASRFEQDDALLWHAVCDYSVRRVTDEIDTPELIVLASIDARSDIIDANATMANTTLNMLDGDELTNSSTMITQEKGGNGASKAALDSCEYDKLKLASFVGHIFGMRESLFNIETGTTVESSVMYAVLDDSTVVKVDYSQAHKWHVPANEREYNMHVAAA